MKKVGKPVFFVVVLLIAVITTLSFAGVYSQFGDITTTHIKGAKDIRWGIDIRGGVDVTFTPPEGYAATENEMAVAEDVIKNRLIAQNITDYELYPDLERNRIILRFPWKADEADFDPARAIDELGQTRMLTFREGAEMDMTTGAPIGTTAEVIVLEGKDVEIAQAQYGVTDNTGNPKHYVSLQLKESGRQKFSDATARLTGKQISIWMDDYMISAPTVNSHITEGSAIISGDFDPSAALELAQQINSGALPFKLISENYSTISPTLGTRARDAMVMAGIIAFIVIALFMAWRYKVPGLVAIIGLLGQVGLMIAAISGFFPFIPSFTLTLPGIAGIILSIGMGVDANVITAERIKEEMKLGKTIDGAIYSGFKRAFTAIFDGNITVIIVAIILMGSFGPPTSIFAKMLKPVFFMFGPATAGDIYSFGYTLLVGVISNFAMGILACRLMQRSLCRFRPFRKPWLFGGDKPEKEGVSKVRNIPFMDLSKRFFTISLALILITIAASFIMDVQLDVQFRGGSIVTYSYEGTMDKDSFAQTAQTLTAATVSVQESRDIATGSENMVVTMPGSQSLNSEQMAALTEGLQAAFPENNPNIVSINNVNATIGGEFLAKCLTAVALASLMMIVYVAFRFRKIGGFSAGVMGVIALIHDIIIVFGVFVIAGFPISSNFIAVVLTILGYSVNDTIVIYDRIRENKRLYGDKESLSQLVDRSINQSFERTLNTTITTVISMLVVTVVALAFNVESIVTFSLPMILGLISGVYSSVCIAGPLWVKWCEYKEAKVK